MRNKRPDTCICMYIKLDVCECVLLLCYANSFLIHTFWKPLVYPYAFCFSFPPSFLSVLYKLYSNNSQKKYDLILMEHFRSCQILLYFCEEICSVLKMSSLNSSLICNILFVIYMFVHIFILKYMKFVLNI